MLWAFAYILKICFGLFSFIWNQAWLETNQEMPQWWYELSLGTTSHQVGISEGRDRIFWSPPPYPLNTWDSQLNFNVKGKQRAEEALDPSAALHLWCGLWRGIRPNVASLRIGGLYWYCLLYSREGRRVRGGVGERKTVKKWVQSVARCSGICEGHRYS